MAEWLLEDGRMSRASEVCGDALEKHPEDAALWNLRGESLLRQGKGIEASDCFRRSLKINPYQPEIARRADAAKESSR